MRKNYSGNLTRALDQLFAQITDAAYKMGPPPIRELGCFGMAAVAIMQEVLDPGWAIGSFGGQVIASCLLADNLRIPLHTIRATLKQMSQAGILVGINRYDPARKRQLPQELVINPGFKTALNPKTTPAQRKQLAGVFAETWMERRLCEDLAQGFGEELVPWGKVPPDMARMHAFAAEPALRSANEPAGASVPGTPADVAKNETAASGPVSAPGGGMMARIQEAAAGLRQTPQQRKNQERLRRLEVEQTFLKGCATVWAEMQRRRGNLGAAETLPGWATLTHLDAAPSARPDRRDLVKALELYGCQKIAVAWAIYQGAHPVMNPKTKEPAYLAGESWRQNSGNDRPPRLFMRQVSEIIRYCQEVGYYRQEAFMGRLRVAYGSAFDEGPRQEKFVPLVAVPEAANGH